MAPERIAEPSDGPARVWFDVPDGDALWARGEHWRMRFDRSGARYFASFGAHLPSAELALSPDRITLGGAPLAFERSAVPQRAGERVELERGSFTEAYELAPDGVEQLFLFETLPRAGALELRIPLEGSFPASEREDGLELATAHGDLRYSRAVTFDAEGQQVPTATRIGGGSIVIRVDGDALATAALPLVIDPFIGQTWLETTTTDAREPDVVFDSFNLVWLAVFQEAFSATDYDVRVKVLSLSGLVVLDGYIDFTGLNWTRPRIAYVRADARCLVVAEVGASGARAILGRTVKPNGLVLELGTQFQISVNDAGEKLAPTVGGDPFDSQPAFYCVAFQHALTHGSGSSEIGYALVNTAGIVTLGPTYLAADPEPRDRAPSLSKSNCSARWTLAFHRDNFLTNFDIRGAYIEWDGTVAGGFGVSSGSSDDTRASASSPLLDTGRSAIAFERRPSAGGQADVFVAAIEDGVVLNAVNISVLENSGLQAVEQIHPSVDSDGLHFFLACSEFVPAFGYYELIGSDPCLAGNTLGVTQAHRELFHLGLSQLNPRVAAARTSATGPNRFMIIDNIGDASYSDISAVRYDTVPGGSWNGYCSGDGSGGACPCGNQGVEGNGCANSSSAAGGSLSVTGSVWTLGDTAVLHATNLPPNQPCLFFQGTLEVADTTFGEGLRCAGGTVVRLGTKTAVGGSASFPGPGDPAITVAGSIPTEGALHTYQAWYRDPSSFCNTTNFNLSNGVRILWAP